VGGRQQLRQAGLRQLAHTYLADTPGGVPRLRRAGKGSQSRAYVQWRPARLSAARQTLSSPAMMPRPKVVVSDCAEAKQTYSGTLAGVLRSFSPRNPVDGLRSAART
jgi:hypothetical protein